jgi:hypothetical protein
MTDAHLDHQRIQRLEDLEAIKQLKAEYCRWSDRGYARAGDDPERVAALFTQDGWWGDSERRPAIRDLFSQFQRRLPFAIHYALNPVIELDGDRAAATWHGLIALVTDAGDGVWVGGTYHDELVRTDAGWRFRRLEFVQAFRDPRPLA